MIHLGKADIDTIVVPMPSRAALAEFGSVSEELLDRTLANEAENRALATLRDSLLPRLLSGELRVRDAEPLVAAAV